MLVGLNVPTNFQMYRQNSDTALWGEGAIAPLPRPPLATLMMIAVQGWGKPFEWLIMYWTRMGSVGGVDPRGGGHFHIEGDGDVPLDRV